MLPTPEYEETLDDQGTTQRNSEEVNCSKLAT